jgi:hypothetical protein
VLVVGFFEHSHTTALNILHGAINAIETAPLATEHVATGIATLLRRMLSLHQSLQLPNNHASAPQSPANREIWLSAAEPVVNPWPPSEQALEVDRQQDLAFQDLWGGDVLGDNHMLELFKSWIGDDA